MIGQTANILLYLGARHALAPKAEAGRLWVHQLQLTITDFVLEVHDTHHPLGPSLYYEDQKSEAKKRTQEFWDERVPKYLGYFERLLDGSGGHYVTGRRLTYVDLSLFQLVEGLRYAFPKRMKAFERKIPGLRELHDRVAAPPEDRGVSCERAPDSLQRGRHLPALQGTGCLRVVSRRAVVFSVMAGHDGEGYLALPAPAVDRRHLQFGQLDAVDAADIDRHHRGPVGLLAARKHFDAAIVAGLMTNRVLVEEIFPQVVFAGAELKTCRREKSEMQTPLGADRAVARGHHREIRGAFETHQAAMAAAGIGFAVRHRRHHNPGTRR